MAVTVVRIGLHKESAFGSKFFVPKSLQSKLLPRVKSTTFIYLIGDEPFHSEGIGKIQSFILFAVDRDQMMEMRREASKFTSNIEGFLFEEKIDDEEQEKWWKLSNGCQLSFLPLRHFAYGECIKRALRDIHDKYWWLRKHAEWQKANPITNFQKKATLKRKAEEQSTETAREPAPAKKRAILQAPDVIDKFKINVSTSATVEIKKTPVATVPGGTNNNSVGAVRATPTTACPTLPQTEWKDKNPVHV